MLGIFVMLIMRIMRRKEEDLIGRTENQVVSVVNLAKPGGSTEPDGDTDLADWGLDLS